MLRTLRFVSIAAPTVALVALTACGTPDADGRQPLGTPTNAAASGVDGRPQVPLAALTALDAGNTAYRNKQFDIALARYREAATAAPQHAAPWFGLYMVASELKNTALADSAMLHVKALSADPAALGAHAEVARDSGLPSGHPSTTPQLPAGHPSLTSPPSPARAKLLPRS
ncbi:MAG: hypothetical protein ABMA00_02520 [Gemmatimonas sp.]